MQIESKIGLVCGIILIVVLICGLATAADLTAEGYYNQGIDFAKLNLYTEAIASYDKALEINPNYSEAWINRGNALGHLNRRDEAIASYDKAIKINPDFSEAWYNRGNAFGMLGRYDEAIASYDKTLEIKPGDSDARQNREFALKQKNQNPSSPPIQQSQQQTKNYSAPGVKSTAN